MATSMASMADPQVSWLGFEMSLKMIRPPLKFADKMKDQNYQGWISKALYEVYKLEILIQSMKFTRFLYLLF